jgi:hypothetical protein
MFFAISTAIGGFIFHTAASAQDKKDEISFDLVPNPKFVYCLRRNAYEEPQAHATVIRGKLNDTLILDLDGIKPVLPSISSPSSAARSCPKECPTQASRAALAWPGTSPTSRLVSTHGRRSCSYQGNPARPDLRL